MGYWDSHQPRIHLQIGAGICTVPTARAVAASKVNNYFDLANFDSLSRDHPGLVYMADSPVLLG